MEMTVLDKILFIIKYITSSFMGIELFLLSLLLFLFTILNIKKNNKIVKIISIIICIGFLIGLMIAYRSYVMQSIDSLIKIILSYLYFPSMVVYFFIILTTTIAFISTILAKKMAKSKKVINCIVLSFLYFCFMAIISLATKNNIDLSIMNELYKNETILSFIQISNIVFFLWGEYTALYYFYKFLGSKLD